MEKPFAITLDPGSSLANHTELVAYFAAGLYRPLAPLQQAMSRW
jgi:hypothetical protein